MFFNTIKCLIRPLITLTNKKSKQYKSFLYSSPALLVQEDICQDIDFTLDHGYVCPLCKGAGLVPCNLCKNGCIFCGYSGFLLCICRLDV